MFSIQVTTAAQDSTPTATTVVSSQPPQQNSGLYSMPQNLNDFPMIDMDDLHIENEIVVQSSSGGGILSPLSSNQQSNSNIMISPEPESSIIVTTQSELIMNDNNMYQESFQDTHSICDNNNQLTTLIEQSQPQSSQPQLTTEIVMADNSYNSNNDNLVESKNESENKVILSGRVSDSLLQNIVASIPSGSMQIQNPKSGHGLGHGHHQIITSKPQHTLQSVQQIQPIQMQPSSSSVKVNVSQATHHHHQPMFVNHHQQIIGSNTIQTIQNSMGNISYILPSSNISKQAIVNKATLNLVSPNSINTGNLVSLSSPTTLVTQSAVVDNSSNIPKCNANFRLIQTSQGQQLVLSPIKSTSYATNKVVSSAYSAASSSSTVTIKPSTSKMFVNAGPTQIAGTSLVTSANTNLGHSSQHQQSQPQQQLIILSPVKGQNIATKPTYLPATSVKILPNPAGTSKMQNIAPASAKRVIAPAGSKPIGISSTSGGVGGGNKPIQTLVHSNNKNVHYISFLPVSGAGTQMNAHQAKLISTNPKYLPLKPMIANKANLNQGTKPNMVQVGQKVLINPSNIKISSTVPSSAIGSATSSSVTSHNMSPLSKRNQPTSIWMLPKQQVIKIGDNPLNAFHVHPKPSKFIPIAPNPVQANSAQENSAKSAASAANATVKTESSSTEMEETRRRPCNCTRSQCLKLYCDCFANGEFCNNCNCVSCYNNLEYEEIRQKAIRLCLERNPNAFHPKIGQSNQGDIERRHTKGCNCKRSGCLKNYCECYEAKILCSDKCKCNGCKNFEESTERKTLMHLADAAEVRSAQQSVATKMHIWGPELKPKLPIKVKSDCHPFNIFTMDILETTASCLLAQAEEGEFENYSEENIQSLILDQFGECLSQILNLSTNGTAEDLIEGTDEDSTINDYENC